MADNTTSGAGNNDNKELSGLGNLPPLSDFDSHSDEVSDAGLPPLGGFESDMGVSPSGLGGLPPIDDIKEEVPMPASGNILPPVSSLDQNFNQGFSSGPEPVSASSGFQDLAADSDFSPQTPEFGPGPSSGPGFSPMDTPMFDTAFGAGDSDNDFGGFTSAPTQAMETPMFGAAQPQAGGSGFDGGFGGSGGGFNSGASGGGFGFDAGGAADFSPDAGMGAAMAGPPMLGAGAVAGAAAAPVVVKKGGGFMLAVIMLIMGLVGGLAVNPFVSDFLPFLPNPIRDKNAQLEKENMDQKAEISRKNALIPKTGAAKPITPEELKKLEEDTIAKNKELESITTSITAKTAEVATLDGQLNDLNVKVTKKNEEYETAQETFQQLQEETFLMDARMKGLNTEVERLTKLTGGLEDANARRVSVKEALKQNVDRLIIHVKESMPLTPQKYDHTARLASAQAFSEKLNAAPWVDSALFNEYTDLYIKELTIASTQEYFFARLPLVDELNNHTTQWSECVMLGNHEVVYTAIDGLSGGFYRNTGTTETPVWSFVPERDPKALKALVSRVAAYRPEGYAKTVQELSGQAQTAAKDGGVQRIFNSL